MLTCFDVLSIENGIIFLIVNMQIDVQLGFYEKLYRSDDEQ